MATKKKAGGARPGSGRKPVTNKRMPVFIYPFIHEVNAHGGKEAVKAFAEAAVSKNAIRLQK